MIGLFEEADELIYFFIIALYWLLNYIKKDKNNEEVCRVYTTTNHHYGSL